MKINSVIILIILGFLSPFIGNSQNNKIEEGKLLSVAKEIINNASFCGFITLDSLGKPNVRMLETLPIGDDFVLWFGTNPRSRKAKEIANDSRVSIYYTDSLSMGYVSVSGEAELVNDAIVKEKHWKDGWQAYYPNKEKDFILIKVIPESLEVVSYPHGIIGEEKTWKAKSIEF